MKIRDRIKAFRRVPASELLPNPKNWRTHPQAQRDALRGILAEIGFAGACLARETPEGLMLIDGHLRAEEAPDAKIPVLILDVSESEADKLLACLDPMAAMAEADAAKLDSLLREIDTESEALAGMLTELAEENGIVPQEGEGDADEGDASEEQPPERWGVYIECDNEGQQRDLLEKLNEEGFNCRGITT